VSYAYGGNGQVTGETWSWTPNAPFTFDYTPSGQYSRMTFPNGQQRLFTYDNQDRLTNITNTSPGGGTVASFDYAYDYDWQAGAYSMRGQRTSVSVMAPGATNIVAGLTKYSYDASYQLVRADYPNNTYDAWTYDAIGNRLSRRVPGGGYTLPYTYYTNAAGGNTQRLRNDSSYDFTYDAAGNVTAASAPGISNAYVWDYANRLTSYGGKTYTYDAFGRASVAASGSTTRYIGMNGNTVSERNTTTGVATDYLFGPGIDEPLAKRTANGSVTYYGADGLGSIVVATDPTGAVLGSTGYSPWGETPTTPTELFGYTARETGGPSWYYRTRYYDAAHGRFLSEDQLGLLAGPSAFAYGDNNPILFSDPDGLCPWEVRSRPTHGVPAYEMTRHRYFYNTTTHEAVGLSTNSPVQATFSPLGAPGEWETHENPKNKGDRRDAAIPDKRCDCIANAIRRRGEAPRYCTDPQPLPKPGFPMCNNCQSWVKQVLDSCP
jgi:RHS repeat-associated protein